MKSISNLNSVPLGKISNSLPYGEHYPKELIDKNMKYNADNLITVEKYMYSDCLEYNDTVFDASNESILEYCLNKQVELGKRHPDEYRFIRFSVDKQKFIVENKYGVCFCDSVYLIND